MSLDEADKCRKRYTRERGTEKRLKQKKMTEVGLQHALDVYKYILYDRSMK